MSTQGHRRRRGFLPHRIVWSRPRLFSSLALGLACIIVFAAVTDWRPATRLLVGWDLAVTLYLVLVLEMMLR
jgi:uncharacterized membrane protein